MPIFIYNKNINTHMEGIMIEFIKSELAQFNIDLISSLSLNDCEITRPYLLEKKEIKNGSVIIFAVPYFSDNQAEKSNISSYAISLDYHNFFESLFEKIIKNLEEKYPDNKFAGFTDHSPINEIKAASKAGLGVIGKNNLLITEKYSSFVFIGEVITDAILTSNAKNIEYCINCGACISACPVDMTIDKCLSSVTQKKSDLSEDEIALVKKHGCAWGCDICQNVCPYTKKAIKNKTIYTSVDFFKSNRTPLLTTELINDMSEKEFKNRAYSWRGKKTILRNLQILEGKEK